MKKLMGILNLCITMLTFTQPGAAVAQQWLEVDIGIIGTASDDILNSAMTQVREENLEGLLIILDTPGGSLEATRSMVRSIMSSDFPIVVWVGPSGSRAASAGAFLTLAGHIAAMASGTNIGAAHPIQASGQDIEQSDAGQKVINDTVAFIESIANARNRNVEMARSFVKSSLSITSDEAFEHKIIDILANNREELFSKISGRTIKLNNDKEISITTAPITTIRYEKSFRQKFLEIISNPNLFYLLFLAGIIGLGFELTHPGALFPGIAGAICLILAFIATSVLPISWGAAALILVGVGLLVAEAFVPSFGLLGISGITAFFIGSIFLVDSHEYGIGVSWATIIPATVMVAGIAIGIGYLILKASRTPVASGSQLVTAQKAVAVEDFVQGRGKVRVQGEIWQATLLHPEECPIHAGDELIVQKTQGLVAIVSRSGTT